MGYGVCGGVMSNFFYSKNIQKLISKALKGKNRYDNGIIELEIVKKNAERLIENAIDAFKTLFTKEKIMDFASFVQEHGHPADKKAINKFIEAYEEEEINLTLISTFFKCAKIYNKHYKKNQRKKKGV
jgi:hypothetical protein